MKRLISLLLVALLMLSTFSGCFLLDPFKQHNILSNLPNISIDFTPQTDPPDDATEEPEDEVLATLPGMEYKLEQEMIDLFYERLEVSEELAIAGEDFEAADAATAELDEAYNALLEQYQIAYVLYCMDQSSKTGKRRYMQCVNMMSEVEVAYNDMCKRVYLSNTPLRDELFAGWTQKDIDMLLAYNEEIAQLENRNSEITVEYRDLDRDDWEENMVVLYNELVQNNNRIAQIYGYDNYYSYAYDVVYQRDYGKDAILQLREHISRYMYDIALASVNRFNFVYEELERGQRETLSSLNYDPYNALGADYVQLFIDSMPQSSQQMMNDMFQRDRAVFTNADNAFEGAFTTMIGEEPFCYFGPGYCTTETVIHELGHYYGSMCADFWNQPMDLSETQSQGNEWMYMYFLRDYLDPNLYEAVVEYRMTTDASYILCFVMIDQFEEQVYSHPNAGNLTLEEYDAIMESVAEEYGGIDMISTNILDIQSYWKQVVLEYPVYYISYAVSGMCAINLFSMAVEDEAAAMEAYRKLMEEPAEGEGFLGNITAAGLQGPFEETVYQQIYSRYGN